MENFIKKIQFCVKSYLGNYISIPTLAWLILPLILMDTFVSSLCLNISVYFTKVKHFEQFFIGEAISLYYVGSFIGAWLGGTLSLKYSSLKIASLSSIFLGLGLLFLIKTGGSTELKIIILLIGVLTNFLSTNNLASFVRTAGTDNEMKLKLVNLDLAVFNLSFSLSAYVFIYLGVEKIQSVLIFTSMLLCILGLYAYSIRNIEIFSSPKISCKDKLCRPKNYKILIGILLTVGIVGLIFSMVKVIYAPTIEKRFGDNSVSVLIASINPWLIFLIQPLLVNYIKRTNNIVIMSLGSFIIGLGYFLFGYSVTLGMTIFSLFFLTLGEILYSPLSKSIIIALFEHGREGFALGLWRGVFLGSGFLGPIISGWVAQSYGDMYVWNICGTLGLSGLILGFLISKNYKYLIPIEKINNQV